MRGARAGNAVEVKIARRLESEGWVVGSRRHIGGAGDLLAVNLDSTLLIEVKSTAAGPWTHFGPAARAEMLEAAEKAGAQASLWWWAPKMPGPVIFDASAWPR